MVTMYNEKVILSQPTKRFYTNGLFRHVGSHTFSLRDPKFSVISISLRSCAMLFDATSHSSHLKMHLYNTQYLYNRSGSLLWSNF